MEQSGTSSYERCRVCASLQVEPYQTVGDQRYWTCVRCRAVFLDTSAHPTPDAERERYSQHQNHPDNEGYRDFLGRLASPLLDRLSSGSEGLDYGCGPGPVLAGMLSDAGHRMNVYDPFFFPDRSVLNRSYDFVTCTEVLEHMHRPAKELDKLGRLVRPGGWLAIMTSFLENDDGFAIWHYRLDPTHVVFYRKHTFEYLGELRGWKPTFPVPHVVLYQIPPLSGTKLD